MSRYDEFEPGSPECPFFEEIATPGQKRRAIKVATRVGKGKPLASVRSEAEEGATVDHPRATRPRWQTNLIQWMRGAH